MTGWPLTAPALMAALSVLTLVLWAGWWIAHSGRRRRLSRTVLTAAVLMSLLTAAGGTNDHFAYLPDVGDVASLATGTGNWDTLSQSDLADAGAAARHPRGGVLRLPVPDGGSGVGDAEALVWLPPQYLADPGRRFPVVYLLHGSPGVPADWLRGGQARDTAGELAARGLPAIIVMPRLSRSWLDDSECVDGRDERVETHFWRDVVPTVDAALRTVPSRDARALAGMSAGGFCALNLGLKHREQVSTVLDLSGLTAPTHRFGVQALYGADAAARAALDSPSVYVDQLAAEPSTRIWLDVGAADAEVRPGMQALAPRLADRGLEVVLHVRPGTHTFHVWQPALADALNWALPAMDRAAQAGS